MLCVMAVLIIPNGPGFVFIVNRNGHTQAYTNIQILMIRMGYIESYCWFYWRERYEYEFHDNTNNICNENSSFCVEGGTKQYQNSIASHSQ